MPPSATDLIASLALEPHPEGGWYRELHRSDISVRRLEDGKDRAGLTVIAFLLAAGERSRWHQVSGADEVWHHGGGDPLELWSLPPGGGPAHVMTLGSLDPEAKDQEPLRIIPAGYWQAARSAGAWSLAYCCVGPGFDFADFKLLAALAPEARPVGADPSLL